MAEEKEEEGWRTDNLPENVRLLMEWSHVNSGPTGYDVVQIYRINGADIEVYDFVVFGRRRLPPLPKRN